MSRTVDRDTDAACVLVAWRHSARGRCDDCGTYADLVFPIIRVGPDVWAHTPEAIVRCRTHVPEGATYA